MCKIDWPASQVQIKNRLVQAWHVSAAFYDRTLRDFLRTFQIRNKMPENIVAKQGKKINRTKVKTNKQVLPSNEEKYVAFAGSASLSPSLVLSVSRCHCRFRRNRISACDKINCEFRQCMRHSDDDRNYDDSNNKNILKCPFWEGGEWTMNATMYHWYKLHNRRPRSRNCNTIHCQSAYEIQNHTPQRMRMDGRIKNQPTK